ncbi:MAG: hypothetical protein ABSH56_12570 [Bryobacteraceae bacterium]|jgi:hypothetical protein
MSNVGGHFQTVYFERLNIQENQIEGPTFKRRKGLKPVVSNRNLVAFSREQHSHQFLKLLTDFIVFGDQDLEGRQLIFGGFRADSMVFAVSALRNRVVKWNVRP